jgi:RAT1-interacting protein
LTLGLRLNIKDEGVWRIRRPARAHYIELFQVEEVGHGRIITDEFMDWRIKLELRKAKPPDLGPPSAGEPTPEGELGSEAVGAPGS